MTLHAAAYPTATEPSRVREPGRFDKGSLCMGPVCAAMVVAPLATVAVVAPKFGEIFRDFGVALPLLTQYFLRTGEALASPAGIIGLLLLTLVVWAAVTFVWRLHRGAGFSVLGLCVLWLIAIVPLLIVSFLLPLVAMIESLQRGNAV